MWSSGCCMSNNWTLHLASGLKWNLWVCGIVSFVWLRKDFGEYILSIRQCLWERNFQICVSLTWEVQLSILYFYWSDSSPVLWFRGALQHWRPSSWHILCIYGEYRYYCFIASGYSNGTSTLTCINLFCSSYGIKSCCEICKNSLEISAQQMFMNSKCTSLQFLRKKKFCGNFSRKQESPKGDF